MLGTCAEPGKIGSNGARAAGDAGRGERAHRRAVVGDLARDHLVAPGVAGELVVLAAELERGVDRLRAARGEEDAVEVARRQVGDARGELDRLRVRVGPVREEAELLRLVGARLGDVGAAVADVHAEQRGEPVEVALAVLVVDVAPLAADDDRDLALVVDPVGGEVHPQVPLRELLKRPARRPLDRRRHDPFSSSSTLCADLYKISVARQSPQGRTLRGHAPLAPAPRIGAAARADPRHRLAVADVGAGDGPAGRRARRDRGGPAGLRRVAADRRAGAERPGARALGRALPGGAGLERPHVAGNSLGGAVALELGRMGAVRSVCALSPAGFAKGWESRYALASLRLLRAFARLLAPLAGLAGAQRGDAARHLVAAHGASRTRAAGGDGRCVTQPRPLRRASGPRCARSSAGASSTPGRRSSRRRSPGASTTGCCSTARRAPRARTALPAARHVTLTGCGHVPTWDDPEQVRRVLLDASA